MEKKLPPIPPKRYFTIGEVSDLCQVKPYVLRYWEQEFAQLKPIKRRGNRRYYQQHEVLLIRRIRELLYEHGFTINGARNQLTDATGSVRLPERLDEAIETDSDPDLDLEIDATPEALAQLVGAQPALTHFPQSAGSAALHGRSERSSTCVEALDLRAELEVIRVLLSG